MTRVLLASFCVASLLTLLPSGSAHAGDANKPWFHVGGGFGATVVDLESRTAVRTGRFVVGGGRYVPFFYGGGEFQLSGSSYEALKMSGIGYVGIAPPIPVFHPLIGVRVGGGHHMSQKGDTLLPHLTVGPQAGFILRKFDGKFGLRFMMDGGIDWRFREGTTTAELMGTLSAVF
ncbi:MAG: hypothetical protein GY898_11805 [Proteobacteria bacterium]|nr:hypothetical protein [Pseudomonadota bacterium]